MSDAELQAQIRLLNLKLKQKDNEIQRLKETFCDYIMNDSVDSEDSLDDGESDQQRSHTLGEEMKDLCVKETLDEPEEDLPEAIASNECDDMYHCADINCRGEVVDNICAFCGQEHQPLPDDFESHYVSVDTQAFHPDRSMVPRGNTPVKEIGLSSIRMTPPMEYLGSTTCEPRIAEYRELLKRGATRLMCETFHLEYTYEKGIFAWADDDLFEEFSGSTMRPGHCWKISLGRRIALDEEDQDGSEFIEGLLEDAVLFVNPVYSDIPIDPSKRWVTEEESPGIWVTYPLLLEEKEVEDQSKEIPFDKSLIDTPLERAIFRPNQYSFDDDDSEQLQLENDRPDISLSVQNDTAYDDWDSDVDGQLGDDVEAAGEDGGCENDGSSIITSSSEPSESERDWCESSDSE